MRRAAGAADPLRATSPFEIRVGQGEHVPDAEIRAALASGDVGFLHSFTGGSMVDGPGVRVVAWASACMFRCRFCHNPDTWTLTNGLPVTLPRAIEELEKLIGGLPAKGGGFTLSGGEPLAQHRFAARLLHAAKARGIHTALATNGYEGARLSDAELQDIDLVLLDMKGFSRAQHLRVCGIEDNGPVLDFARRLARLGRPIWLRYVLAPGLTDVDDEIAQLAEFAAGLGGVERAEVLPFHQMGRYKWSALGLPYELEAARPPTLEQTEHALAIFRAAGLEAR